MLQNFRQISAFKKALLGIGLVVLALSGFWLMKYFQNKESYKIGIILSPSELPENEWEAIEIMVKRRVDEINENGGLDGRKLHVVYFDDEGNEDKLSEIAQEQIKDESLIAFIGAQGINRALTLGPIVTRGNLPVIGNYVYTSLTDKFPTMYSAKLGLKEGRKMLTELLQAKATKVGFIGLQNSSYSKAYLEVLQNSQNHHQLVYQKHYPLGHTFTEQELEMLADSLRGKIDFLVCTSGLQSIYPILKTLEKHAIQVPVYCGLIDIEQLDTELSYVKSAELYDFNSLEIPGTQGKNLYSELTFFDKYFEKTLQKDYQPGLAGSLADVIGMIAEAANENQLPDSVSIRSKINSGLKNYTNGIKIYRGWINDLYFTDDKALAGNILIGWKPRHRSQPILAPGQYIFIDSGTIKTQVLYTSIDMVRIDHLYDDESDFLANFYLQIQSDSKVNIEQLEFTNAVRNAINHESLIETKLIRTMKDTAGFRFYHYLYHVSGKFHYDPDLKKYPLDVQLFPISIQAANTLKPILIQPAYLPNRDTVFEAAGWTFKQQFVSFDQSSISSGNYNSVRKNIPYYNFTFMYVMKRTSADYFLKTLMPLFIILTIAYFAVYIPSRMFEAQAGIQVTSLLSSIALYFATFKPQIQYATTSDKIFIFSYIMVTTLIGTSILLYIIRPRNNLLKKVTQVYQRVIFPLIVIGFSIYIRWF